MAYTYTPLGIIQRCRIDRRGIESKRMRNENGKREKKGQIAKPNTIQTQSKHKKLQLYILFE